MTVAKDQGLGAECASLQVIVTITSIIIVAITSIIIVIITTIIIVIITTIIIVIITTIIRRQSIRLVLALPQTWWSLIVRSRLQR